MKNNFHKRLFSFLVAFLLLVTCIPAAGFADAEPKVCMVYAYTYAAEAAGWLYLLDVNGTAYVAPADIETLCGNGTLTVDNGNYLFTSGSFGAKGTIDHYMYQGNCYINLKDICDIIRMQYYYSRTNQTVYFIPCTAYAENLYQDCIDIFNDRYDLKFIENKFGVGLAAAFNIIGGMRFDALWGGYAAEQYEATIAGIMENDLSESDTLEYMSDFDKTMGKLVKLRKFDHTNFDGTTIPYTYIDNDYAGFVDAYGEVSKCVDGLEVGDFLEIAQRVYAGKHALDLHVNAVKYGIIESDVSGYYMARYAAQNIYNYYDENTSEVYAALIDEVKNYGGNIAVDFLKDKFVDHFSLNKTYISFAKLLFDEYGMKDKTKAVERTAVGVDIQNMAYDTFLDSYDTDAGGFITGDSALKMKYSTILYLRACQYGYSLYSFEKNLKSDTDYWKKKTSAAIKKLAAYDDELMTEAVYNEALPLYREGFYYEKIETEQPVQTAPPAVTQKPSQTPAPTQKPVQTPAPTQKPVRTPSPTQKPVQTPAPFGSGYMIADGTYEVEVSKDMIKTESYGWRFYADTYVPDTYTDEVVSSLQKGSVLDGVTITSIKKKAGTVYLNGDTFILRKNSADGLWHSYHPSDAPKTHYQSRQEFRIFKGSTKMYDRFSYLMFGEGSQDAVIANFPDYFNTVAFRNNFYSSNAPIFLTITVENGSPTKVVWEYRP